VDGGFTFHDVKPGVYLLDVLSDEAMFSQVSEGGGVSRGAPPSLHKRLRHHANTNTLHPRARPAGEDQPADGTGGQGPVPRVQVSRGAEAADELPAQSGGAHKDPLF